MAASARCRACAVMRGRAPRQGAGLEELLLVFDTLRVEHELMDAGRFNDDGTYKKGINEVMESDGWSGVSTPRHARPPPPLPPPLPVHGSGHARGGWGRVAQGVKGG